MTGHRRTLALSLLLAVALGCGPGDSVKIGAVLPLTGDFELYGQSIRKGIELGLADIQADEDYPYAMELEILDSGGNPELAAEQLAELYSGGAVAVIGGVITDEALKMVPVADRFDRILISPSASTPELTGISKNFYRIFPSDSREGTTMGNFASRKLQAETVVILAKEGAYAKGIQEVFKGEYERNGGKVLEVIEYPPGAADLSGFIDRILTLEPQAVYLAAYAGDIALMISELRKLGYEGNLLTTAAFAAPEVIEQVGEPAEGVFLTQAVFEVESEDPRIQEFATAYRDKFGLSPDLYAAHGYDSILVLAEALSKAGPFASDFWKGMRRIEEFPGLTGTIQFDEKGDVQKFPRVYVIEGGNLMDYEREVERRRRELLERLRRLEEEQRRRALSGN